MYGSKKQYTKIWLFWMQSFRIKTSRHNICYLHAFIIIIPDDYSLLFSTYLSVTVTEMIFFYQFVVQITFKIIGGLKA